MTIGIRARLFEAGHCVHPGFMVRPGLGLAAREFPATVALVEHPRHGRILFDTGYHPAFAACTRRLPERLYALTTPVTLAAGQTAAAQLAAVGIAAGEVDHLLISHFHADHIAGLCDFPESRLYGHLDGYRVITEAGRISRIRKGYLRGLLPDWAVGNVRFVAPFPLDLGEVLGMDQAVGLAACDWFGDETLYLVELPGHAAGQLGLLVRLAERWLFLLADGCWLIDNLRDAADPHPLAGLVADSRRAYAATLAALRRCYGQAADRVIFVPTHCRDSVRELIRQEWLS